MRNTARWECECWTLTREPCPAEPHHLDRGPYTWPTAPGRRLRVTRHCLFRLKAAGYRQFTGTTTEKGDA